MTLQSHAAAFADLDAPTLHALLRLRVDVFVVEQKCAYPEIDGRDDEPGTRHLWLTDGDRIAAYLRILDEPDGAARIGRVAVDARYRGTGLAGRLMVEALDHLAGRPCTLDAQTYLTGFYSRFGFAATGPEFLDEGVAHVPMRRDPVDV